MVLFMIPVPFLIPSRIYPHSYQGFKDTSAALTMPLVSFFLPPSSWRSPYVLEFDTWSPLLRGGTWENGASK